MAGQNSISILLTTLLLFYTTTILAIAAPNPHPQPTPPPAFGYMPNLNFLAARDTTSTSGPRITATCTSTGFNSVNSMATVTGRCVVETCETPTVGLDGRPSTSTGTCTVIPIGRVGAAVGMPTAVKAWGTMVGVAAAVLGGI